VQERLLDLLDREAIRATFFLQGRWIEAWPSTARRVAEAGHVVGNHSHYHVRMPLLSAAGFAIDVRRAERVIGDVVGADPRPWFRLPFGTGAGEAAVHRRLERLGYRHVHWDVNAEEWQVAAIEAQVAEEIVRGVLERGDGAVVLLHAWPRTLLGALDAAAGRLRDAGARFVGIDELESLPSGLGSP
jgi:peptidoglycan/xylan/chitin deacetylase (PgdA/CDA1 family)